MYMAIVGDVHVLLHLQSLCFQRRFAATESVHHELVDASLQEVVKSLIMNIEGACQIVGKLCRVCPKRELFFLTFRVGNGSDATGIGKRLIGKICHSAHSCEKEDDLNVFAAIGVRVEELRVFLHGLLYPFFAINGCAEMNGRSFDGGQDVEKHFFPVDDILTEARLFRRIVLSCLLIILEPVGMHNANIWHIV